MIQTASASECFSSGPRPYRVVEIASSPIGNSGSLDLPIGNPDYLYQTRRNTFGINRNLEIVFFVVTDTGPPVEVRAFVRLPVANYGLAAGTHELPLPTSPPGDGVVAVALDINDDGVIVGYVGESVMVFGDVDVKAFVWQLADSTLSNPPEIQPGGSIHPTEIADTGCASGAWAVNNESPPWIVGEASRIWCDGHDCDPNDPLYGFIVELDNASSARRLAGTNGAGSRTFAISSTDPQIVVGLDTADAPPTPPNCLDGGEGVPCPATSTPLASPAEAQLWFVGSTIVRIDLTPLVGIEAAAAAAGVDDDGVHIVGDSGCPNSRQATFWEDVNASPVDLGAVCGSDFLGRADDIVTFLACDESEEVVIAVGGDLESLATVWSRVGGLSASWCCSALTGLALPTSATGTGGEYEIEYAHAVAPTGHIVVHGRPRGTSTTHAYLLTCAADLSGDGRVDATDQGLMLLNWGACPSTGPCVADLNGDAEVDGADIGLLMLGWSGTALCQVWPTTPDCGQSESLGGSDLLAGFAFALAFFGFDDVSDLAAWYATASATERDALLESINTIMLAYEPEEE